MQPERLALPRCFVLATALLGSSACSQADDDVREWRPTDHKHQTESNQSTSRAPQVSGSAEAPVPGLEEVTIAAWKRNCTSCHGQLGRGDGPQAAMVKARDLSDPTWQAAVTDTQIAESIVKGRGSMPAFPLPPETVASLVRLVRLFNRDGGRPASTGPAPSGSAPAATGTPSPSVPAAPVAAPPGSEARPDEASAPGASGKAIGK